MRNPPTLYPYEEETPITLTVWEKLLAFFVPAPTPIHTAKPYTFGAHPAIWCGANIYSRATRIAGIRGDTTEGVACEDCRDAQHAAKLIRLAERTDPGLSYSSRRAAAYAKRYGTS